MHYVFLGNCQLQALRDIFRRFIGRNESVTFDFVNAYEGVTPESYAALQVADVVVLQKGPRAPAIDRRHIPQGVPVHLVPSVNGTFLWPFQGVRHPLKPAERYGNPPYPEDYNDEFLAKLILQGVPAEQALKIYKTYDVAGHKLVRRMFVHNLRFQKSLDGICGFDTANIIENYLQDEQLFQAPYHFSGRLARHLSATLSRRMGFPETYARRIETYLIDAPFLPRFLPVHPSIATHFGLRWVSETTRYAFLYEGGYTFDEYVLRFMEAKWSPTLQEGVIDAQRFEPNAKAKLIKGLLEAPRSAVGHHALAGILEREGDIGSALGRVDGFNQHQPARKTDDGRVADVCFLAAHGNALEALELAHGLFDASTKFIEALRKKAPSLLGVFAARDNWCDAAGTGRRPVGLAVISLVRHRDARADVRAYVE